MGVMGIGRVDVQTIRETEAAVFRRILGEAFAIVADAGRAAALRLVHNGRVVTAARRALRYTAREPGVYRLEGYRQGRPWLFTNPIYVTA
jgi:hypothetical protein